MHNGKNVIGICTAELEQPFHAKLVERVVKELTAGGDYVLVFSSDSDLYSQSESDLGDAAIYDLPNYDIVDAVLIFSATIRSQKNVMEIVNRARAEDVPIISVGMEIEGCYNVIYNMDDAFEKVVRHIVEYHGMKEINFMSGIQGDPISEQRLNIFKQVLDENDILFEEDRVGYGEFWQGPTIEVMKRFMHPSKVPPEAIICANDSMAVAVCDYLAEMDIRVPEEILVTGIDGIDEGKLHFPAITTAVRDEVNDAKKIVDLIKRLVAGQRISHHLTLGYHMQLSQSCGCQKHQIFDQVRLLRKLNDDKALRVADIRRYADMEGVILKKESLDDILDVVAGLMPENSFLCINDDLEIGKYGNSHRHQINPYTSKLKSIVKINGDVQKSNCNLNRMIPEIGWEMASDVPILMLPIHFEERVVGYLGIRENVSQINMISVLHFLRGLDHSLGYKLSE